MTRSASLIKQNVEQIKLLVGASQSGSTIYTHICREKFISTLYTFPVCPLSYNSKILAADIVPGLFIFQSR